MTLSALARRRVDVAGAATDLKSARASRGRQTVRAV